MGKTHVDGSLYSTNAVPICGKLGGPVTPIASETHCVDARSVLLTSGFEDARNLAFSRFLAFLIIL